MVSKKEIQKAKSASLYDYLLLNYPDDYKAETKSLVSVKNKSLHIARHPFGESKLQFTDFNGSDKGDSIDYLTRYLSKDFESAVLELCGEREIERKEDSKNQTSFFLLGSYPPYARNNRGAVNYLKSRGIHESIINMLINAGYIYQCKALAEFGNHERLIFLNREQNYYEVREIEGSKFCTSRDDSPLSNDIWYMNKPSANNTKPTRAYITESAIDAISLYQLIDDDAFYVSIGGVANSQRIQRVIDSGIETIIATDNDKAGEECRNRFNSLKSIIPHGKDWNEDLRG